MSAGDLKLIAPAYKLLQRLRSLRMSMSAYQELQCCAQCTCSQLRHTYLVKGPGKPDIAQGVYLCAGFPKCSQILQCSAARDAFRNAGISREVGLLLYVTGAA